MAFGAYKQISQATPEIYRILHHSVERCTIWSVAFKSVDYQRPTIPVTASFSRDGQIKSFYIGINIKFWSIIFPMKMDLLMLTAIPIIIMQGEMQRCRLILQIRPNTFIKSSHTI